jgi:hypothetical protein
VGRRTENHLLDQIHLSKGLPDAVLKLSAIQPPLRRSMVRSRSARLAHDQSAVARVPVGTCTGQKTLATPKFRSSPQISSQSWTQALKTSQGALQRGGSGSSNERPSCGSVSKGILLPLDNPLLFDGGVLARSKDPVTRAKSCRRIVKPRLRPVNDLGQTRESAKSSVHSSSTWSARHNRPRPNLGQTARRFDYGHPPVVLAQLAKTSNFEAPAAAGPVLLSVRQLRSRSLVASASEWMTSGRQRYSRSNTLSSWGTSMLKSNRTRIRKWPSIDHLVTKLIGYS